MMINNSGFATHHLDESYRTFLAFFSNMLPKPRVNAYLSCPSKEEKKITPVPLKQLRASNHIQVCLELQLQFNLGLLICI